MRVALACPYAWDVPGGVQLHVAELARRLRDRGHDVVVLTPSGSAAPEPWVRVVGRPVRVPFNGSVAPIAPGPWTVPAIRSHLRSFRPDVVHVHEPFAPSTGLYATLVAGAPVVATFHTYADRSAALAAFSPALRPVWNRVAVRLAVSGAAARFAGRHFAGGVRVVPNGLDVDRFRSAEPAELPPGRRVLFVGRLEPRKGFRHALAAFAVLLRDVPDALLVAAGEGPERGAVDQLPAAVRDRVRMLGAVSHDDLPRYHAAADVFLAPNTGGESFGYVVAEAMASGLPVVASDIPGFREVLTSGAEGLLVPVGNPEAVAGALRRVLTDPDLASSFGAAGRRKAERYRWETVAGEIEAAYREAVSGRAASRGPHRGGC